MKSIKEKARIYDNLIKWLKQLKDEQYAMLMNLLNSDEFRNVKISDDEFELLEKQ